MKAVKHNEDHDGLSICIIKGKLTIWFDLWLDGVGELQGDWNKYIFFNGEDDEIKKFQESSDNFEECFSLAEKYVEDNFLSIS